jgi:hypothetical protein
MSELPIPQITEENASNYHIGLFFGNVSFTVYKDYASKFGDEYAKVWLTYMTWKKTQKKEKTGTACDLYPEEIIYFNYAKKYYEELPTL